MADSRFKIKIQDSKFQIPDSHDAGKSGDLRSLAPRLCLTRLAASLTLRVRF